MSAQARRVRLVVSMMLSLVCSSALHASNASCWSLSAASCYQQAPASAASTQVCAATTHNGPAAAPASVSTVGAAVRRLSVSSWCSGWSATREWLVLERRTAALGVTGLDIGHGSGGDLQRSSDACGCWPVVRLCCISAMLLVAGALVLRRPASAPGAGGGERVEMGMELRPRGGEVPAAAGDERVV
jgi:hypothetical protein